MVLFKQVSHQLNELITVYGLNKQKDQILKLFEFLSKESLGIKQDDLSQSWSSINNDGFPFQLAVSSEIKADNAYNLRFIIEPGSGNLNRYDKYLLSFNKLKSVFTELVVPFNSDYLLNARKVLLPSQPDDFNQLLNGSIWIGLDFSPLKTPRVSIYFESRWGAIKERWLRIFRILGTFNCFNAAEQVREIIRISANFSHPLGIALDFKESEPGRIKIYFYSNKSEKKLLKLILGKIGIPDFEEKFNHFFNTLYPELEDFPNHTVVYYLGISTHSDSVDSIKIDVCTHCLGLDDLTISNRWRNLSEILNINIDNYILALKALSNNHKISSNLQCHAYTGIGFSKNGKTKLNQYLRPAILEKKRKPVSQSKQIEKGVEYLLNNQIEDGSWLDFLLPPGTSDSWVTGYIGYYLTQIVNKFGLELDGVLSNACDWLLKNQRLELGWGYNNNCDVDCDSTSYVILFLNQAKRAPHIETYSKVFSFQSEDGGFSTYYNSKVYKKWGISHPDVTPVAIKSLLTRIDISDSRITNALQYIVNAQSKFGFWNSYWWSSNLYSTMVNLELLTENKISFEKQNCIKYLESLPVPNSPLDQSFLLRCFVSLDEKDRAGNLKIRLMNSQRSDGSWNSFPALRVTNNEIENPWESANPGTLHKDQNRLFTTVSVLYSLSLI